jgi:hypothetical protein
MPSKERKKDRFKDIRNEMERLNIKLSEIEKELGC